MPSFKPRTTTPGAGRPPCVLSNLEHGSVVAITTTPSHTLMTKVFVRDPSKLSWADGFAISQGYLYIADSHLWKAAFKNNLPRSGPFTIFKVKFQEGSR
jgi:hypothetical protein